MGKGKAVTIGYKYFLGIHMVICHGPFNSACDRLEEITVGERSAWTGNVTGSTQINIEAPNLFGGEKNEGGVAGAVDIMCGEASQPQNSYLTRVLGNILPAFRSVVSVVARQCYIAAMNPYPKAWAFKVRKIPAYDWYPAKAIINNGANGAHIIYEVLTNSEWAMGYAADTIDETSFRAVADTLHSENLSLSFSLTSTDSIESFIYTVVQHINGMFYTRPDNGKFALKLLRNNYVADNLPVYDESNIVRLESFERPSYAEMINEIVVVYRPQGTKDDNSVTVQDLAGIAAQEGIISQTINYPGIDTAENAARVAMRDLRQKSTPLARVKMSVLRSAWNVAIGDCLNFTWAEHGVTRMVLRVLAVNVGSLTSGEIVIDAIEDVFGLPNATYIGDQPSGWVDPIVAPAVASQRIFQEAPFWDVARAHTEAEFAYLTNTSCFVESIVPEQAITTINYELWTKTGTASYLEGGIGHFAAYATTSAAASRTDTTIIATALFGDIEGVVIGSYGTWDSEIVRIDGINDVTRVILLGRGCLDTVPATHALGSRIIFSDADAATDGTEYSTGETVYGKVLTRTGKGLLQLSSSPEDSVTLTGRFAKPYAPGKFQINGAYFPVTIYNAAQFTWAHRDRTQQLATVLDFTAGNVGPETGTTYNLNLYNELGTLVHTETGLTGAAYNWITEIGDSGIVSQPLAWYNSTNLTTDPNLTSFNRMNASFRVTIESQVGTRVSFQKHDVTTNRGGYGTHYGSLYGE